MKTKKPVATFDMFPPLYVNVTFGECGHIATIDEHYYHEEKKANARNRSLIKAGKENMVVRRLVNWIQIPEVRDVGDKE